MPKINEINNRKDLAFLLFQYTDEVHGKTEFQKLLFLLQEETEFGDRYENLTFEFEAYKYGPFSEGVFDVMDFLFSVGAIKAVDPEDHGEIIRNDSDPSDPYAGKKFVLTERGKKMAKEVNRALDNDIQVEFEDLVGEFRSMPNRELLEYVYRQYPAYTTESEIKDEILG